MNTPINSRARNELGWTRLRFAAVLSALVLGIAGALIASGPARAASGPFVMDGVIDAGATQLPDTYGNVKELGPKNASTTKIGVIHNSPLPVLGLSNPNAQVDLRNAWIKTAKGSETIPHDWLYFAWERDANSGSGFIAYEFMKSDSPAGCVYTQPLNAASLTANCNPWANRQGPTGSGQTAKPGDFMILWDQQGSSLNLFLRTWSGTAPNLTLGPAVALNSAVSEARYSDDGFKGEAAIDLTATIFANTTECTTFANVIPSTVTGNSDSADYKDTILIDAPSITNCGGVTITKKDDDSPQSVLSGATFTLYTDLHPNDSATGHIGEDTATAFNCTTGVDGTCEIVGVPIGDYWVVETTTPAGHAAAADQKLHVTAGATAQLTFTDARQFKVITIVCKNADNSLYPSSVTFDGGGPVNSLASAPGGLTEAQLCALGGASFSPKLTGTYNGSVTIPQ